MVLRASVPATQLLTKFGEDRTQLLTKFDTAVEAAHPPRFHEDWTINVASRRMEKNLYLYGWTGMHLQKQLLTKFGEDRMKFRDRPTDRPTDGQTNKVTPI
ncbi:hypothetical protein DPMN_003509 [Dreissena polymorpha]|uniref:Uncharacterized protein n=1 Tax=Dreissena polymorpha TaxID=45954 RepID=A0A9D4MPG7_DREPO|nr:hypothetical protein DPMN_003509 [Dreissena polymorpha]